MEHAGHVCHVRRYFRGFILKVTGSRGAMAIRFVCECGKKLSAPDFYAGREGKCNHCGKRFVIPGEAPPASEQPISQTSAGGGTATLTTQKAPKAVAVVKIGPPR